MKIKRYNWKLINESFFDDLEDDIFDDSLESLTDLYKQYIIKCTIDKADRYCKFSIYVNDSVEHFHAVEGNKTELIIDLHDKMYNNDNTSLYFIEYPAQFITSIDFTNFNTSNVINMFRMFRNCSLITTLDLTSFDTSNVTSMEQMFYNCSSLTTLKLSSFDTYNVTNMTEMFYNCRSLTTLDLSSFDTSNVTEAGYMFYNCSSLKKLNLSNFNIDNRIWADRMFSGCYQLEYIKCTQKFKDWCWKNSNYIMLPDKMIKGGSGVWDIVN